MNTIEQVKKNKNYLAHAKGYPIDPEGFTVPFLMGRLEDERRELLTALTFYSDALRPLNNTQETNEILEAARELVVNELADMSNIIDYLATKLTLNYPDKYTGKVKG